jgi:hypothetical protein
MTVQCTVCKQTFLGSCSESELRTHVDARHPKSAFEACFANWQEQKAKMQAVKTAKS